MNNRDHYKTLARSTSAIYREKGSKFISYGYPLNDFHDVELFLSELRKENPKARHFCYAYRFDPEGLYFRANDDGEPSGTAGRPILGALESYELYFSLMVVVRYFGGTKLGASGLIQAYRQAAILALEEAEIVERISTTSFKISYDYAHMGQVLNSLKSLEFEIIEIISDHQPHVIVALPRSSSDEHIIKLKANLLNRSINDVKMETEIPFLKITKAC